MRTDGTLVQATVLANLERRRLEAAWGRAWEAQARAAQAGDYAAAERWYERATLLGTQLTATDRALGQGHRITVLPT
jgi:hypothetical protein